MLNAVPNRNIQWYLLRDIMYFLFQFNVQLAEFDEQQLPAAAGPERLPLHVPRPAALALHHVQPSGGVQPGRGPRAVHG